MIGGFSRAFIAFAAHNVCEFQLWPRQTNPIKLAGQSAIK